MKRAMVLPAVLLTLSMVALGSARPPSILAQSTAKYVGTETCKGCHEDVWTAMQKTAHGRAEADGKVIADVVGCESCHGPGSEHADAGGDDKAPGFATVRSYKGLPAEKANEACLGCHKGGDQFYWAQGAHARNDVTCVQCHDPHHSKAPSMIKATDVNSLCGTCHKDKKAEVARNSHMPVADGSMTCASCHNPHGTSAAGQIKATTVNELCNSCHGDKRGPMLFEHAPVRENCMNCHKPHGGSNPKMLTAKTPYLCQRCHVATRHPSTAYDQYDVSTSPSTRLLNRSCLNCHVMIHGSNNPSGVYFVR
jgi:DmsE family decaheme c-type cytochrome